MPFVRTASQAIVSARKAVPNAEVLRATLCREAEALVYRITLLRLTSMTQKGRLDKSVEEIRAIYRAIEARDGAGARKACVRHIEAATKVAIAVLTESEAEADLKTA